MRTHVPPETPSGALEPPERLEDGEPFTVKYHLLSTMLLNELQEQDERLADLEERLEAVESLAARTPTDSR